MAAVALVVLLPNALERVSSREDSQRSLPAAIGDVNRNPSLPLSAQRA